MRRPNFERFQKKPSAGASNNGRIDEALVRVCVRARKARTLKMIKEALSYILKLQCYSTIPGIF